jgi:saccharopine dehydrogenase-like NADP-dependent oxidoreductase
VKVCIIGCGNQGGCLAGLMACEQDIEHMVLADMNIDTAKNVRSLIKGLGDKAKVKDVSVDTVNALDAGDVARVAKGASLVFNGILPFCNIAVMKGCLKAGAHYMDLYSMSVYNPEAPYNETIEAQMELDEEFKAAGLTALPCEGVQPGWVNLAAKYVIDQMDTIDSVIIRGLTWIESKELIAQGPDKLQIMLNLHIFPSSYIQDGKVVRLDSVDHGEEFEFPEPVGKKIVYMESLTAVEKIIQMSTDKPIRLLMSKGAILGGTSDIKETIFRAVREQVLKHPNNENINIVEALASSLKSMANMNFKEALENGLLLKGADASSVDVTGTKDGQNAHHVLYYVSSLHEAVKHIPWVGNSAYGTSGGMPIITALMLLRGEITKRGVLTPAQLDNPKAIFKKLEERGHYLCEKIELSSIL